MFHNHVNSLQCAQQDSTEGEEWSINTWENVTLLVNWMLLKSSLYFMKDGFNCCISGCSGFVFFYIRSLNAPRCLSRNTFYLFGWWKAGVNHEDWAHTQRRTLMSWMWFIFSHCPNPHELLYQPDVCMWLVQERGVSFYWSDYDF